MSKLNELRVSKVMLLASLVRIELEGNCNVASVDVSALADDKAVKAFIMDVNLNVENASVKIEFGYKLIAGKFNVSATITTDMPVSWESLSTEASDLKSGRYVDDDKIVITRESPVEVGVSRHSVEKMVLPLPENQTVDGWRSMARDIVGMALKKYNSNK